MPSECWIVFYGPHLEYRSHACFDHGLVGNLAARLHGISHHFVEAIQEMKRADLQDALLISNVQAMIETIRVGEGTTGEEGFRKLFGGNLFDSFAKHPNIIVSAGGYESTAAGVGQFLHRTWVELETEYGFPDFSPQCQLEGMVALIYRRHALDDVKAGDLTSAIDKCNKEWASLPGSPYGQPVRTMAQAEQTFTEHGGVMA